MHWKFDPFFTIDILHGKYPPPAAGQADPPVPSFSVEPTGETRRRLLRMGWVFRPYTGGGGGALYAEKMIAPDGTAKLRARPAPDEGFTFIIRLADAALLNQTKPYAKVPSTLPAFSGRSRLLYFNNLNAVSTGTDQFSLSAGSAVGLPEFGSRMPTVFIFQATSSSVTQVKMDALIPGGTSQSFPVNSKTRSAAINLPENGYRLTQQPGGAAETLFLTNTALPANSLGVLRIFQPPGADWEPFRRYQILFDKA